MISVVEAVRVFYFCNFAPCTIHPEKCWATGAAKAMANSAKEKQDQTRSNMNAGFFVQSVDFTTYLANVSWCCDQKFLFFTDSDHTTSFL